MAYCTADDLHDLLGSDGVTAFIDDDLDGYESADEAAVETNIIERVSVLQIDPYIEPRYGLTDSSVTGSTWLKWANAVMAAAAIVSRRGNPIPAALSEERAAVVDVLMDIRDGKAKLPRVQEEFDHLPSVTNYSFEPIRGVMKPRVSMEQSTGESPEHRKRWPSKALNYYD